LLDTKSLDRTRLTTRLLAGREFLVKTPLCASYLKQMNTWLTTGSHGAIVYGRPRLGKTSATRWVLKALPNLVGNFPVVEVPIRAQNIATERAFFQHLLRCIKHRQAMTGSAGDKRDRFSEWLTSRAMRSSINCAVLFLDEAQLLQDHQYGWLLNISNELDKNGCRLFCLFVGQPELADKKLKFIDAGMEQIVGRFMVRELEFSGISSEVDLISTLNQYQNTIYPIGSNILFSENFIPLATKGGFVLDSIGPALWGAFEKLWIAARLDKGMTIPMHYFTSALIGILNLLVKHDTEHLVIPQEIIVEAVNSSGYKESLRILLVSLMKFEKINGHN
jgi:hypothetical protein